MVIHLVSYDLNTPGKNYDDLINTIKNFPSYYHLLKSAWLISTKKTTQEAYDKLKPHIDDNDHIFVSKITNRQGWIPNDAWEWIKQHE